MSFGLTQRTIPKPPLGALQALAATTLTFASASFWWTSATAPTRSGPWTRNACLRSERESPAVFAALLNASVFSGMKLACAFPPLIGKAVKESRFTLASFSFATTGASEPGWSGTSM